MAYRVAALQIVDAEATQPKRVPRYERWRLTLMYFFGYFGSGAFLFWFVDGLAFTPWLLFGLGSLVFFALLDHRFGPERVRELERVAWLLSLPRRPDGGVSVDQEIFDSFDS